MKDVAGCTLRIKEGEPGWEGEGLVPGHPARQPERPAPRVPTIETLFPSVCSQGTFGASGLDQLPFSREVRLIVAMVQAPEQLGHPCSLSLF